MATVPQYENFEVQEVEPNEHGYGFNITGPNREPILATITYTTKADAEAAREVIQKAAVVRTPGFLT
jgi:hypothetical protein